MNNIDFYMSLPYRLEIIPSQEGGYVASYPELKGCITTGETLEDIVQNAEAAKKAWFLACIEDDIPIPDPTEQTAYSGQFKLRVPKTLHKHLAMRAKEEGISMNQYCACLLAKYS